MFPLACVECGYDLRAHAHCTRCPECGVDVQASIVKAWGGRAGARAARDFFILVAASAVLWFFSKNIQWAIPAVVTATGVAAYASRHHHLGWAIAAAVGTALAAAGGLGVRLVSLNVDLRSSFIQCALFAAVSSMVLVLIALIACVTSRFR